VFYYSNYTPNQIDRLRLFFYYASKLFCKNESEIAKAMKDQLSIECASKYVKALSQALAYISEAPFEFANLPDNIQEFVSSMAVVNQNCANINDTLQKNIEQLIKANMMMEEFAEKSVKESEEIEKELQFKLVKLKALEDKIAELSAELESL